jgi:hypothetical protein
LSSKRPAICLHLIRRLNIAVLRTYINLIETMDQIASPAFRAWFGASQMVDAAGHPLVLYHGTKADIDAFDASASGEFGPGIYLSANPDTAHFYAAHVAKGPGGIVIMPVYAAITNPFRVTKLRWIHLTQNQTTRTVQRRLVRKGHDGIVGTGINGVDQQIVAFRPEQIKSAIGNRGGFMATNPRITE